MHAHDDTDGGRRAYGLSALVFCCCKVADHWTPLIAYNPAVVPNISLVWLLVSSMLSYSF
jgi:hypothetical protein